MTASIINRLNHCINLKDFLVGGAVTVIKDNQAVYQRGFGKARLGLKATDFTPDTIVCIMSLAKSFTAAALLRLADEGHIDLDTPLRKYLPYFRTTDRSKSDLITVKQLLSHTAGFAGDLGIGDLLSTNAHEFVWYDRMKKKYGITNSVLRSIHKREDVTKYVEAVSLTQQPGCSWNYCTDAYIIAADLFEKVSGQSWDEYMELIMFKEINLTRTTLSASKVQQDEEHACYYTSVVNSLSDGQRNENGSEVSDSPFPVNPLSAPMGFMYSTASDLGSYMSAYMREDPFMPRHLIDLMFEPVWQFDPEEGYALGWGTSKENGYNVIEHGGGFQGVSAYLCMVPSEQLGVVVLSNHDKTPAQQVCYKLLNTVLQELH